MNEPFEAFEHFPTAEHAAALVTILEKNNISYTLEENQRGFDPTFASHPLITGVVVKIKASDFLKANHLLEENARQHANQLPQDHYLREFSQEELLDVLRKPAQWSKNDVVMARQLLQARGEVISETELHRLKEAHHSELKQPVKGRRPWIVTGFILAVLIGWPAIAIGWNYYANTQTAPDGQKYYKYDPATRRTGVLMMVVGAFFLVSWYLLRGPRGLLFSLFH